MLFNEDLSWLATGRREPMFTADVERLRTEIEDRVRGRRVLVIGGAGSIGSATVHALADFTPQSLHVVDLNENNLAELVRDLRSRPEGLAVPDLQTIPIDFGSPIMYRFLRDQKPYDYVLNFAAVKHVRSEKNTVSLLQMIDTNVLKPARFLRWLAERKDTQAYFCVSTDKAANPVSLMGASKRLMEHVIFSGEAASSLGARVTSARFANVAFSDGSLLQGFLKRLEKRQPLATPRAVKRFFISLREAGQICLLAAVCAPHRHILVPRLVPETDLRELETIAVAVLQHYQFEPYLCETEAEARSYLVSGAACHRYPLLLTPLDTSGEKPYEEFFGRHERPVELGMADLLAIDYLPAPHESVTQFLALIPRLVECPESPVTKAEIVEAIRTVVPELQHEEKGKSLDARM